VACPRVGDKADVTCKSKKGGWVSEKERIGIRRNLVKITFHVVK